MAAFPCYDVNSSVEKDGLALNIDTHNNELDFQLVKSVGEFFQLDEPQMGLIISDVKAVVENWEELAADIGIPRSEQQYMSRAFTNL